MNERRMLDAMHLRRILLRVFRAHQRRTHAPLARSSSTRLSIGLSGIELSISPGQIEDLAQHIRTVTAFQVSTDSEGLAHVLAQIALIVDDAAAKVAAVQVGKAELLPTAQILAAEYALECASEYARLNRYAIDTAKLPEEHFVIGLMTNDEQLLTRVFQESLRLAGRIAGSGRHARQTAPAPESEPYSGNVTEEFQDEPTKLVLVQSAPDPTGTQPRFFESDYWNLRHSAAFEGWTVHDVLMLIERRLSYSQESEFTRGDGTNNSERYLTATSYWNLRSISALNAWTVHERLMLIEEHLSPTLSAEFAHYSDSESGPDWQRLYYRLFPPHGRI